MTNNINNNGNQLDLTDRLIQYLGSIDVNEPIEVKPNEYVFTQEKQSKQANIDNVDLEVLNKDYSTKLDKQLKNIGNNIVIKFFELNDEKFKAVMNRIISWGYELCLEEFITNYYLIIKKDNRLRQFVLLHLTKLIKIVKDIIEKQLTIKMNNFDFTNVNDQELSVLTDKLAKKESELLDVNPEKLTQDNTLEKEVVDLNEISKIKNEILQDLKENNPELERETWI